jgi:hypothetical protein
MNRLRWPCAFAIALLAGCAGDGLRLNPGSDLGATPDSSVDLTAPIDFAAPVDVDGCWPVGSTSDLGPPENYTGASTCQALAVPPPCGNASPGPLQGSWQLLLSLLQFAHFNEGIDLDCDGKTDNVLSPLGALANPMLTDSFTTTHDLILPLEIYAASAVDASCAQAAFYQGVVDCPAGGGGCDPFAGVAPPGVHLLADSFWNPPMILPSQGSLCPGLLAKSAFLDVTISGGTLTATGGRLELPLPGLFSQPLVLDHAWLSMPLAGGAGGVSTQSARLGGVLEAVALAQTPSPMAGGVFQPGQTLLDAAFLGPLATILGLVADADGHYLPDIDVDGDGPEYFWQSGTATPPRVDTCRDGDGTIIHDNWDGHGARCVFATDNRGRYRFVDGLSAAFRFNARPARLLDVIH